MVSLSVDFVRKCQNSTQVSEGIKDLLSKDHPGSEQVFSLLKS